MAKARRHQTGNRRRKVWRKELKASWSRKAHRRVKLDALPTNEK